MKSDYEVGKILFGKGIHLFEENLKHIWGDLKIKMLKGFSS